MKILLPIILAIFVSDQLTEGHRILGVFPLQGKSHWVMMEQLLKGLAKRGHQVDVISHFPLKKSVPNYHDISIAGTLDAVINNMTAKDIDQFGSFNMQSFAGMGSKLCDLLELPQMQQILKNPPNDPPYDLVITESFVSPCYMAFGRYLKVPLVLTVTSALHDWLNDPLGNPMNTAVVPTMFSAFNQHMTFWERLQNTFLSNVISWQLNYYMNDQAKQVKKFFGIDATIDELYKDVSLLLVNSHHSLHGIRPFTPSIVEVGGLHVTEDGDPLSPEVQKWLDESKAGCVFFTFGSMVRVETFPQKTVEAFYKVFERIAPVRVLLKVAKKEDLLPGLPKNVMIQPWFPQMAVLTHKNMKAFITHGGAMGTQESIYAGVPMVGIPLFGDQHVNILNYVSKKAALTLGSKDNVTEESLFYALDNILHNPVYRNSVKKLSALFKDRPMTALQTAVYSVEYVIRHKNVLQSPAIHLSWWQRNLLDVYGFILFCVVAALLLVLLVLRTLKNLLFGKKGKKGCCTNKAADSKKNK